MGANRLQVGAASSSAGASISVASRRARSTKNWGRAREVSREGERVAKRLRENVSITWQFCHFLRNERGTTENEAEVGGYPVSG